MINDNQNLEVWWRKASSLKQFFHTAHHRLPLSYIDLFSDDVAAAAAGDGDDDD